MIDARHRTRLMGLKRSPRASEGCPPAPEGARADPRRGQPPRRCGPRDAPTVTKDGAAVVKEIAEDIAEKPEKKKGSAAAAAGEEGEEEY